MLVKLGTFTSYFTKKPDARAKLLFCQSKPISLLTFAWPSPSLDLKVLYFFFLTVTEKVWESESTDASDDEPQLIIKPPVSHEKRPSPVKKTGAKKTHSDMKGKGVKQSSLTSFFKKS